MAAYDLVLASLVAVATLLLGQAIVAYEIFTGRVLPRRSFVRHWRYAILLAGGYVARNWLEYCPPPAADLQPAARDTAVDDLLCLVRLAGVWRA